MKYYMLIRLDEHNPAPPSSAYEYIAGWAIVEEVYDENSTWMVCVKPLPTDKRGGLRQLVRVFANSPDQAAQKANAVIDAIDLTLGVQAQIAKRTLIGGVDPGPVISMPEPEHRYFLIDCSFEGVDCIYEGEAVVETDAEGFVLDGTIENGAPYVLRRQLSQPEMEDELTEAGYVSRSERFKRR